MAFRTEQEGKKEIFNTNMLKWDEGNQDFCTHCANMYGFCFVERVVNR